MKGHKPHSLENITHFDSGTNTVVHYTCNAPNQETLNKYNIKSIGDRFGCADAREVLEIPAVVYEKFGIPFNDDSLLLILCSERLLRDLPGK